MGQLVDGVDLPMPDWILKEQFHPSATIFPESFVHDHRSNGIWDFLAQLDRRARM